MEKSIEEIIKHGTPKEKAILYCMRYEDPLRIGHEASISEDDVIRIDKSIRAKAKREEYQEWVDIYCTFATLMPTIGVAATELEASVAHMGELVTMWALTDHTIRTINNLTDTMRSQGYNDAATQILRAAPNIINPDADIRIGLQTDETGRISVDISDGGSNSVRHCLKQYKERAADAMRCFKGAMEAVLAWADQKDARDLFPPLLSNGTEWLMGDMTQRFIPLFADKNDVDEMRSYFPSYDTSEQDNKMSEVVAESLNNTFDGLRRQSHEH